MFIELTNQSGKKVLVDVEKIAYAEEVDFCEAKPYTLIVLDIVTDDEIYQSIEVVESIEQIKAKLL